MLLACVFFLGATVLRPPQVRGRLKHINDKVLTVWGLESLFYLVYEKLVILRAEADGVEALVLLRVYVLLRRVKEWLVGQS